MTVSPLDQTLERCECALLRIERSAASDGDGAARETQLRAKVAAVVAELDQIIGAATRHDSAGGG